MTVAFDLAWLLHFAAALPAMASQLDKLIVVTEVAARATRVSGGLDAASRKITFSNVNSDFGPKGLIGSFIPGSAAEKQTRELLERYGKLPSRH